MSDGTLDLRTLPRYPTGSDAPEWWGIMGLVLIETVVFITTIGSYFHLRTVNDPWPPPVIGDPALLLPSIETLILVLSPIPAWLAWRRLRQGDAKGAAARLAIAVAALIMALGITIYDFLGKDWGPTTHAYGSMYTLMAGLHTAHTTAAILVGAVVLAYLHTGRAEPRRPTPMLVAAIYYSFVAGVGVPVYITLYLSPHLLP